MFSDYVKNNFPHFIVRGFIFQGLQMDEFILYGTRKTHAHMIFNNRILGKDRRKCVMVQNGQQVSSVTRTTFHCHSGYSLLLDCLALMLPPKEESQGFSGYYHPVLSSFLGHNLQQSSFKAVDFLTVHLYMIAFGLVIHPWSNHLSYSSRAGFLHRFGRTIANLSR